MKAGSNECDGMVLEGRTLGRFSSLARPETIHSVAIDIAHSSYVQ
jgi:hypothetical protein